MASIGLLVLVVMIAAIVYAVRAASRDPRTGLTPGAQGASGTSPRSNVADDLARWVAAGLLSPEQSAAIRAHEETRGPVASGAAPRSAVSHARGAPVVAEALGYLGGMLAIVGLVLVVARYWTDMAPAGRLALSGSGALGLWAAGGLVREQAAPALARLRGFLWLASTAAATLCAQVLVADVIGTDAAETVVLVCAGAVVAESGLLWWGRDRPIQQLTLLGGVAVLAGALVTEFAAGGPAGITVWGVGVTFVVLGLRRFVPQPVLTEAAGAIATVAGGAIAASNWQGFGLVFLVATAFGLLALATIPGPAPESADQVVVGLIGAAALLATVPGALGYFSRDAGAATGFVTWSVGALLALMGARRVVRLPVIAEVLGGAAIIGGAALTGTQWRGFAPVFGMVTAVGLVALGMLPGQVLLSMFGSVGLLINVPWAIGWFFPGEGRAPLLILVAGALIVVIAVFLGRGGGRFRRDLEGLRHPKPPTGLTPRTN